MTLEAAGAHERDLRQEAQIADAAGRVQRAVRIAVVDQVHRQVNAELEAAEQAERSDEVGRSARSATGRLATTPRRGVAHDELVVRVVEEQPEPPAEVKRHRRLLEARTHRRR